MSGEMPRDPAGLGPCEWCGKRLEQPATGRRRRYCSAGHKELAYRERKQQRRIAEALEAQRVLNEHQAAAARPVSSTGETRRGPVPSVDETRRRAPGRRRGRHDIHLKWQDIAGE